MINKIFESLIISLIVVAILFSVILWIGSLIEVNTITPVEESKIDSITSVVDSLNIELINIDSIRNENIKNAASLNNTESIELFKWLLSR